MKFKPSYSIFYLLMALASFGAIISPFDVSFARDAFGLDAYKKTVDSLTKSPSPFKTKFGNSINVYTVPPKAQSKGDKVIRFLVQGGLHGNEILGSDFVAWLAQRFAAGDSSLNHLNAGFVEIDFIPYANPDGTILYARYNANHINLNRNFSVLWGVTKENPGSSSFSEPESKAIRELLLKRQYTGAVDVHGYVNWVVGPTSPGDSLKGLPKISAKKFEAYQNWNKALARAVSTELPGYEFKTAGSLGDGGAFEDYAWWEANVPAFCLEAFSNQRYVMSSAAARLLDLLTPTMFERRPNGENDMFLVYESFIKTMFQEAIKLQSESVDLKFTAAAPQR